MIILLAPTDMIAWANSDPDHEMNLIKAKQLLSEGRGEELVGAQCWPLDKTPLSAQSYLSKSEVGAAVDIYGVYDENQAPISKIAQPMLIPYGTDDIGITHPFGNMDTFREKLSKIKNPMTELATIQGSSHSFQGFEKRSDKRSRRVCRSKQVLTSLRCDNYQVSSPYNFFPTD